MRASNSLLSSIAAGQKVPVVQLLELQLSTTVYLTNAGQAIEWDAHSWAPMGLGRIEQVEDVVGELRSIAFILPAVSPAHLSLALTEPVEGKTMCVYDAFIDPATGAVGHVELAFAGTLNVPTIDDGPTAAVSVTAEHRGVSAVRPKPTRYTDDDQRRRYGGDSCLDFDPATDAAPIAWPRASFFRR
mgnify:CR=1 FL=1